MSENQLAGLIVLTTSIIIYILGIFIQKSKRYTWFSGWNPEAMTDPDSYGEMLCKSLKAFAIVLGFGSLFMIFIKNLSENHFLFVTVITLIFSFIVLIYYMIKAKKLYGK